jgi:hypothetical protein
MTWLFPSLQARRIADEEADEEAEQEDRRQRTIVDDLARYAAGSPCLSPS